MPQTLKAGTFYMMVGLIFSMGLAYATQVIASRSLGPEIYGKYGLVLANVALIAGLIDPGLSAAMATFAAEQDVKTGRLGVVKIIKAGMSVEIILSILLISISLLFFQEIGNRFFSKDYSLVVFFLILTIIQGFYGLFSGAIQGLRELKGLATIRIIEQLFLLFLLIITINHFVLNLENALLIQVFAGILALLITFFLVTYYVKHLRDSKVLVEESKPDRWSDHLPEIMRFAIPVSLAAFSSSLILSSGPIVLNYLTNNSPGKNLGIFVVILTVARALNRVITTFFRSAFPYLVNWNTQGRSIRTKQYTEYMSIALVGGYAILFFVAIVFGEEIILLIYGEQYVEVATYLPIALIAFCLISLKEIFKVTLYSIKIPAVYLLINFLSVIVYFLSIAVGKYVVNIQDAIMLILASVGLANLFVTIGSVIYFRARFGSSSEQIMTSFPNK